MKGVILAAGISSRLRPLTDTTPKCLLPIGGETILERTLNNLTACGIRDIVIVGGYLEDRLRSYVSGNFPELGVKFLTNEVYATTNNIYSLWLTKPDVLEQGMILLDSDIIFEDRIIQALLRSGHENCLAVNTKIRLGDEEIKVAVDRHNRIRAISKEVPPGQAIGESIGIELFGPSILKTLFEVLDRKILLEKAVNEFYEAAFQEVIDRGGEIYAVDVGMYKAIEIDTAEDLLAAEKDILPHLPPAKPGPINKR
jgi:choline kinase